MVGPLGVAAALVGAVIVFDTDEDHDDVVQKTADNLEPKLPNTRPCTPITSTATIRIRRVRSPISTTQFG